MKRILLFSLAALCASCSNELLLEETEPLTEQISTRSVESPSFYVENGVVHFTSSDAFFEEIHHLSNMPDEEFEAWEKENNFLSSRTIVKRLVLEAENIVDEAIKKDFVSKNSKYIKMENGEILSTMNSQVYLSITNADGVFYVGDTKNVVDDIFVTGYENESRSVTKFAYCSSSKERLTSDVEYETREAVFDDRKVITSARIVQYVAYNEPFTRYALGVEIFIDGKAKGAFGRWKDYNTTYGHKNFIGQLEKEPIDFVNDDFIYRVPGETYPMYETVWSSEGIWWKSTIAISTPLPKPMPLIKAKRISYEAFTRGTNPNTIKYIVEDGKTK